MEVLGGIIAVVIFGVYLYFEKIYPSSIRKVYDDLRNDYRDVMEGAEYVRFMEKVESRLSYILQSDTEKIRDVKDEVRYMIRDEEFMKMAFGGEKPLTIYQIRKLWSHRGGKVIKQNPDNMAITSTTNHNYTVYNDFKQINVSNVQMNFPKEVVQLNINEREEALDELTRGEIKKLDGCSDRLKKNGFCDEDGRFIDQALIKALQEYGSVASLSGQYPYAALKGLFEYAIRQITGISNKGLSAFFYDNSLDVNISKAVKYSKEKKGVYACMREIVNDVFEEANL